MKLFLCALTFVLTFAPTIHAQEPETSPKDEFNKAQAFVAQQDWDSAMTAVLAALRLDGPDPKKSYKELLVVIAPEFYRFHEAKQREAMQAIDLERLKVHSDRIGQVHQSIEGLNLTEGRGRKEEPLAIAQPSPEALNLYKVATEAAARQKYDQGLEYKTGGVYKEAAIRFRQAFAIVPGFEDAEAQYQECRSKVLKRVALCTVATTTNVLHTEIADAVCEGIAEYIKTNPDGAGAFEFVDVIPPVDFRMKAGSVGIPLDRASDYKTIMDAATRISQIDKVLIVTILKAEENYPGLQKDSIEVSGPTTLTVLTGIVKALADESNTKTPDAEGTLWVYRNSGEVNLLAGYSLRDVATSSEVKAGSVVLADQDEYIWATLDNSQLKYRLDDETKEHLDKEPGTPMPALDLAKRAAEKGAPQILSELSGSL